MIAPKVILSAAMVALLAACSVTPVPLTTQDMKEQAKQDKGLMFADNKPLTKPLTLSDAIARALAFNLDRRTKVMEEALAMGLRNVDRWDLLPQVVAKAGYKGRSEPNATSSTNYYSRTSTSGEPNYSEDRDSITAELGLSWNVLDFGVSYLNAHQNADRALIAGERRRKTVHNLIQEVRFAYWRALSAQTMHDDVAAAVTAGEAALADARKVEGSGLKAPFEMLRYQKALLENLRQLEVVSNELSTARYELAALINLPPGTEVVLDTASEGGMTIPAFDMPVEKVEELAFVNNPDLREQTYLSRIAVDETRKSLLKMLPGINFSVSRQYDANSYLVDNRWNEAGARISWNLLNLPALPDQMDSADANEKVAESRRIALRMAVLAQVQVAYRNFLNASHQYERADELYSVEKRLAAYTAARAANDAQSVLDHIAGQTSAIAAKLRRYQSYAQMQSAFGRLQATMGQDLVPNTIVSHEVDKVSTVIAERLASWDKGVPPDLAETVPAQPQAPAKAEPVAAVAPVQPAKAEAAAVIQPAAASVPESPATTTASIGETAVTAEGRGELLLSSAPTRDDAIGKWGRLLHKEPRLKEFGVRMVSVGTPGEGGYVSLRVRGDVAALDDLCQALQDKGQFCKVRPNGAEIAAADGLVQ